MQLLWKVNHLRLPILFFVQEGHKKIKVPKLLKVMQSKEIKDYIKKEYGDDVIPYESK